MFGYLIKNTALRAIRIVCRLHEIQSNVTFFLPMCKAKHACLKCGFTYAPLLVDHISVRKQRSKRNDQIYLNYVL